MRTNPDYGLGLPGGLGRRPHFLMAPNNEPKGHGIGSCNACNVWGGGDHRSSRRRAFRPTGSVAGAIVRGVLPNRGRRSCQCQEAWLQLVSCGGRRAQGRRPRTAAPPAPRLRAAGLTCSRGGEDALRCRRRQQAHRKRTIATRQSMGFDLVRLQCIRSWREIRSSICSSSGSTGRYRGADTAGQIPRHPGFDAPPETGETNVVTAARAAEASSPRAGNAISILLVVLFARDSLRGLRQGPRWRRSLARGLG